MKIEHLKTILDDILDFYQNFNDNPRHISEWGHYYFCPEDGARLSYDRHNQKLHRCTLCNKDFASEKLDRVWTTFYRNDAFTSAYKTAIMMNIIQINKSIDIIENILQFYSDNYILFKEHRKDEPEMVTGTGKLGAGKIMPQELNEAIIAMRLAHTVHLVKSHLSDEYLANLKIGFVAGVVRLLKPQINRIHNIPFWCALSLAALGHVFADRQLVDFAYNSEFGIKKQLQEGVTADGFWYEGSIHYNYFILEGIIFELALADKYHYDITKEKEIATKMLLAGYYFAFDNDVFPNPNDGWPNINLKTYAYIYHLAASFLGSEVEAVLASIMNCSTSRVAIPLSEPYHLNNELSLEHLYYSRTKNFAAMPRLPKQSYNFPSTCFAMLRNKIFNVFIKYGHNTRSHAHPDKMNIEVTINNHLIAHDLSNTGYGADICNQWHRTSVSHNTVVLDGKSHTNLIERGTTKSFDFNHLDVSSRPYENTIFNRKITINENKMNDVFKVVGGAYKTADYFLHLKAKLLSKLSLVPANLTYQENGYQHLKQIQQVKTNNDQIVLEYSFKDDIIELYIDLKQKQLFLAQSLDNPVNQHQSAIIIRSQNKDPQFSVLWVVRRKV